MPTEDEEETKITDATQIASVPVGHMQGQKLKQLVASGHRVSGGDIYLERGLQKAKIDRFGKVVWL